MTPLRRRVLLLILQTQLPRIAALILTLVIVVPTIALLPHFHDLVTAESARRRSETIPLFIVFDRVEHVGDVAHAATGKLAVVGAIATGRRRKHDKVPVETPGSAFRRVVVLSNQNYHLLTHKSTKTYRRAKIVADFVR